MRLPDPLPVPPTLQDLLDEGPVSLFIDFDGTLVDIAARPDAIVVPGNLGRRLEALSTRLDGRLALVSGRALDTIEHHLGPSAICRAGSHGASRLAADGSRLGAEPRKFPDEIADALRAVSEVEGLDLEIKAHGGALHYRAAPHKAELALARARDLAERHGLAVKTGKSVVELVGRDANKGAAVRAFMAEPPFAGSLPVFIGDDATDEDGFVAAEELSGFGIAVGDRPTRTARYRLDTVAAVYQWLAL